MSDHHLSFEPHLDPNRLSAADRKAYYSGEWLAEHPVKSKQIARHRSSDADMAAELLARVHVELEHFWEEQEQA